MNTALDSYLSKVTTKEGWQEVWDIVKSRHGMWESSLGKNFTVGDSVHFRINTGRNAGHRVGIITGMTARAAKVNVHGVVWTVAFSFLEKVV